MQWEVAYCSTELHNIIYLLKRHIISQFWVQIMRIMYSVSLLAMLVFIDIQLFDFGKDWFGYKPNFPRYARFEIVYHYPNLEIYIADRNRLNVVSQGGRGWKDTFDTKKFLHYSSNSDSLVVATLCSDSLIRYRNFFEKKNEFSEVHLTFDWLSEEDGNKFFERNGKNDFPFSDTNPILQLFRIGCLIALFYVHKIDLAKIRLKFTDWRHRRSDRRKLMHEVWHRQQRVE